MLHPKPTDVVPVNVIRSVGGSDASACYNTHTWIVSKVAVSELNLFMVDGAAIPLITPSSLSSLMVFQHAVVTGELL